MKIGQFENTPLAPVAQERKPGAAAAAVGAKVAAEPSAHVDLSATVAHLAAGGTEGVFDTEKVQRISDAIRDGKFKINPDAIADKLIANAQELLSGMPRR